MPQPTYKTRGRIRESMESHHHTTERFDAIQARISGGGTLCLNDYYFYRRNCKKIGVVPLHVPINRGDTPIAYRKVQVSTVDLTTRYRELLAILHTGKPIVARDYRFLKRFCQRTGADMPKLESKLLFWEVSEPTG